MLILGHVTFTKTMKKITGYERSKYKCTLKCIFCLIMSENGVTMNYRYMHMFNTVRS